MGNTFNKNRKKRSAASANTNTSRSANFAQQTPAYPTQQLQVTPPYLRPPLSGQMQSASRVSISNVAPQRVASVAPETITSSFKPQVRMYDGHIVNVEGRDSPVRSVAPAANSNAAEFHKDNRSIPLGNSTVLSPRVSGSSAEDTGGFTPNHSLQESASSNSSELVTGLDALEFAKYNALVPRNQTTTCEGVNLESPPRRVVTPDATPVRPPRRNVRRGPTTAQNNVPIPRNQTTTCEGHMQQQYRPTAHQNETTSCRGSTHLRHKKDKIERKKQAKNSGQDQYEEPPNDFRELPIYPTTEEVTGHERSFVKENITKGHYRNANHYLDVQFRLLREDFVGSLREDICNYIQESSTKNLKVRVHQRCQFVGMHDVKGEMGVWVHFQRNTKRKPDKHEFSKRFFYGGLLCFTNDNFATLIFAKIIDRNEEDLEQGRVAVAFEENSQYSFGTNYVMVECNVFFEPYYHVLNALQKMNIHSFPMQRYIVKVKNDIRPPNYSLDLFHRSVDVNGLNHSQYGAFQAALTKEFAIIQGPPGTGKTYLAQKIVETLVANDNNNYQFDGTPILIVCYTNHALDQFLEGLIKVTTEIVRVGGQSKNENLMQYNINVLRGQSRHNDLYYGLKKKLDIIIQKRKRWIELFNEIQNFRSVVSSCNFSKVGPEFNNNCFTNVGSERIGDKITKDLKYKLIFDDRYRYLDTPISDNVFDQWCKHLSELQRNVANFKENKLYGTNKFTKKFSNLQTSIAFAEQFIHQQLKTSLIEYKTASKQFNEVRDMEDVQLMRRKRIVGMTTTGAARLRTSLQALECKIVIVEEAAEVLEAHIIAAITSSCKHLILIGDHQQLRPSTANYNIESKMRLGISLFERMVMNDLQCSTLNVQHRMRPQIADLIRPAIYSDLRDHKSVIQYPPVVGVDPCLYFIDHNEHEEVTLDTTKKNLHEAKFLVMLARHLILNGYKPRDITILATYSGQKHEIDNRKKEHHSLLQHVRVDTLDNYQGEECKIILLSLVRNNTVNSIGFLNIENRVCVALSRAKVGFYIMGNMDLLCRNSEIWPKIRDVLVRQNALGPSLQLRCVNHQAQVTEVKRPSDFNKVLQGGCQLPCKANLVCGHKCTLMCHLENRDHQKYSCKQSCTRTRTRTRRRSRTRTRLH